MSLATDARPASPSPADAAAPDREESARPDAWTIRRVLGWTTGHFEKKGVDAPRLTAEILLSFVLKLDRVRLYVDFDRPLSNEELAAYRSLISRRMAGEPTQYLVKEKYFYNRRFYVDERVLVPRPETELLVEAVLAQIPKDAPCRILDLCTGSGCIAVTLAAERPLASVWAVDLSPGACEVARQNAEAHGVETRVTLFQGDLFAPLPPGATFDWVVSNPPYIASGEIPGLSPEVRREPLLALDGGADGLEIIRPLLVGAKERLSPEGRVALEIAETQGPALLELLTQTGYRQPEIVKDLERRDRFAFALR